MIFRETNLKGSYVIEVQKIADARGFFGRAWCKREFGEHGLTVAMMQANIAFSNKRGTLRGLHYQEQPFAEAKLVRCTRGAA
jgi:dTDP-4-dehydrorhamnose 3,5-epimerase